jgi:hypothetical protein
MLKLLTKYKGIAMVNIQDGSTASSWQDMWQGKVRESEFPHLYSFAIRKNITIQQVSNIEDLHDIFQLPLTNEAYQEYTSLVIELENFDLTDDADIWSYIWGSNQCTVQKAYKALIGHMPTHIVFGYLWRSKCQPKHKDFFFWLLLQDKLNTRGRLRSRHMELDSYTYQICMLPTVGTKWLEAT